MRHTWIRVTAIGVTALCAASLAAGPALANGKPQISSKIDHFAPLAPDEEVVPVVSPGEEIGIACDALEVAAPENDVRVVLTISATPHDKPIKGYKKVLATNEQLMKGAVRVRIPEMPDLTNHTVNIDVYVVNAKGSKNCDAGHMRIAERLKRTKGQQS